MKRVLTGIHLSLLLILYGVGSIPAAGQTWDRQTSPSYTHFSSIQFLDERTGWACGSSGHVVKTTDKGATWFSAASVAVDLNDLCFVDANTGWVTGVGGFIFKTADGGGSWGLQSFGTAGWFSCITFRDALTGWVGGRYGVILKTADGGMSWNPQSSGTASSITDVSFISSTTGWMSTDDGHVLRTTNGGTTWNQVLISSPSSLNAINFVSGTTGWVAGTGGRILKSTDGGITWVDQTSGTTQQLNGVSFVNPDTGWVAGNGGIVLATTNGGTTWVNQISTTTENLEAVQFLDAEHGHAVGLNNIILEYAILHSVPIQLASFTAVLVSEQTVRLNWTTLSEINNYGFEIERAAGVPGNYQTVQGSFIPGHGTTNEPQRYAFTDQTAPQGVLYYRLKQFDLDGTVHYTEPVSVDVLTGAGESNAPVMFALKQNYPNPFNPSTRIDFSIPAAGFVSLRVYDVLGREVATIVNEHLDRGTYSKTFSADGLSSGVYLYKLTSGTSSQTRKFVLAR